MITFIVIFAIGALSYSLLVPSFETTEFNPEVVEDISKGITTTTTISEVKNTEDNSEILINEDPTEDQINIANENIAQELIKYSVANNKLENYKTYLIIGSDKRSANSKILLLINNLFL